MSTVPKSTLRQNVPEPVRRHTVFMGRQDFVSVLLRLIGVELYKMRRRTMPRILGIIVTLTIIMFFGLITASSAFILSTPNPNKQALLNTFSGPLRLPNSLTSTVQIINYVGLILIIILAGTIVGGEYGVGTIRLMFTRGATRTQFFLSKLGALLACITLCFIVLVPLGIVMGALLNLVTGIGVDFSFFSGGWLLHALLYLLIAILGLFMYAVIAVSLSTWGKATVAGVAGGLLWWFLEGLLSQLLPVLANFSQGAVSDILRSIPEYFIGNNVDALLLSQSHYLTGDRVSPISNLHAGLVLAVYLILFIGLTWWVNEQRDVTN